MATHTTNYNLSKPEASDAFSAFRQSYNDNMDIIDANLGGGGGGAVNDVEVNGVSVVVGGVAEVTVPTQTSDLNNDSGFLTSSDVSAVAMSGDYDDLTNKPTIPTATSDLVNDSDFVSDASYVHTDNNFTTALKDKLDGIEAGAEVNVQADWNEADSTDDAFIKNKPTIPTATSDLVNDSGFTAVSVTQIQSTGTKIAEIDVDGVTTDIYAPAGGSGDTVSWNQIQQTGTKIAEIDINGVTTDVYAPQGSSFSALIIITADAGQTVTATKGGDTYTATEVTSGTYEVTVDSAGTWTISDGTISDTIAIPSSGTYYITLSSVPDGKTVTPTDDVQILLACAGITDKSYTTLTELFADTTTLASVIADNNAIDYLKRSTTFAKSEALVPTMTSNTTPSGTAFANPENSTYPAWKAFDNNNTTYAGFTNTVGNDIGYTFPTKTKVAKLLLSSTYTNTNIFTIQGSDDGVTYTDIKDFTGTGQAVDNSPTSQTETFNSSQYLSFKIKLKTKVAGYSGASINTLQFYSENGFTENATAMSYIGLNNYASNTLLGDATWCNAICNSTYFESVLNVKVPVMTSNTTPSGVCSASDDVNNAYKAFDGNINDWNYCHTTSGSVTYTFNSDVLIKKASLYVSEASGTNKNISIYGIEGIKDGLATMLISESGLSGYLIKDVVIPNNNTKYPQYRLSCGTDNGTQILFRAVQFYGRADV